MSVSRIYSLILIRAGVNDGQTMPLIEIETNKFINTDHIVRMDYQPQDTRTEEAIEKTDHGLPKKIESSVGSSIAVILSNGDKIERRDLAADELYKKLTGEEPPKIRARIRHQILEGGTPD